MGVEGWMWGVDEGVLYFLSSRRGCKEPCPGNAKTFRTNARKVFVFEKITPASYERRGRPRAENDRGRSRWSGLLFRLGATRGRGERL